MGNCWLMLNVMNSGRKLDVRSVQGGIEIDTDAPAESYGSRSPRTWSNASPLQIARGHSEGVRS